MAETTLIVKAKDEASGELKKVSGSVNALASAIGTAGLTAALLQAGNAYAEAERDNVILQQKVKLMGDTIGVTSDQLAQLNEEMSKKTTFDDEMVSAAQSVLLNFDKLTKETFPEVLNSAADVAAAMGMDIPQAAQILGRSMQSPTQAIKQLRSINIMFTDAEKDSIAAMEEAGDVAGAQRVILDKVNASYGGMAETIRNSPFGTDQALKNNLANLNEEFGKIVAESLQPLKELVVDVVGGFLSLDDGTKKAVTTFGALAVAIPAAVMGVNAMITAVKSLSVVMATNPIGLIVTGAGLAAAALISLNQALSANVNSMKELARETEKVNWDQASVKTYEEQLQKLEKTMVEAAFSTKKDREAFEELLPSIKNSEDLLRVYTKIQRAASIEQARSSPIFQALNKLYQQRTDLSRQMSEAIGRETAQTKAATDAETRAANTAERRKAALAYANLRTKLLEEYQQKVFESSASETDKLIAERDRALAQLSKKDQEQGETQLAIRTYYSDAIRKAEEANIKAIAEAEEKAFQQKIADAQTYLSLVNDVYSSITGIVNKYYANQIAAAEDGSEKEKQIQREQFEANKWGAIGQMVIDGAEATIKAIGTPPVPNVVLGGIMGGLAAAQIGIAMAEPNPYAMGGVTTSGMSIVGEKGPELIQMPGGATVYSNALSQATGQQTSGGNMYVSGVTIYANDPDTLRKGLLKLQRAEGAR